MRNKMYAAQIVSDFIKDPDIDLNAKIADIAVENDLSKHAVYQLVEVVNHQVNTQMRKLSSSGSYSFKTAKKTAVMNKISENTKTGSKKVASMDFLDALQPTDYAGDRINNLVINTRDDTKLFKLAKDHLSYVGRKLQFLTKEAEMGVQIATENVRQNILRIKEAASEHVELDHGDLREMYKAAMVYQKDNADVLDKVFKEIYNDFVKEGKYVVSEVALGKLKTKDHRGISPKNMDIQVLNGTNKFYGILDSFGDSMRELNNSDDALARSQQANDSLMLEFKGMNSEKDIQKYLDDSIYHKTQDVYDKIEEKVRGKAPKKEASFFIDDLERATAAAQEKLAGGTTSSLPSKAVDAVKDVGGFKGNKLVKGTGRFLGNTANLAGQTGVGTINNEMGTGMVDSTSGDDPDITKGNAIGTGTPTVFDSSSTNFISKEQDELNKKIQESFKEMHGGGK